MATTMKLIAKNVLASAVASVSFSDIPQTYTDLMVLSSLRSTSGGTGFNAELTFNGSTSGYSERLLYGTGSGAASASASGSLIRWTSLGNSSSATASTFSNTSLYIPNYASTTVNKSVSSDGVNENNATAADIYLCAGLWSNTSAITSMTFATPAGAGNFAIGSSFYLYGITKA